MMVLDRIAMVLFLDTGISMKTRLITVVTMFLSTAKPLVYGAMMKILHFQESGRMMMVIRKESGGLKKMSQ